MSTHAVWLMIGTQQFPEITFIMEGRKLTELFQRGLWCGLWEQKSLYWCLLSNVSTNHPWPHQGHCLWLLKFWILAISSPSSRWSRWICFSKGDWPILCPVICKQTLKCLFLALLPPILIWKYQFNLSHSYLLLHKWLHLCLYKNISSMPLSLYGTEVGIGQLIRMLGKTPQGKEQKMQERAVGGVLMTDSIKCLI